MSEFDKCISYASGKAEFVCDSCKKSTPLIDVEKVSVFACKCGRIHSRYLFEKSKQLNNVFRSDFPLKPGCKGEFEGKKYSIVGIANKRNQTTYDDKWTEYVLYCETDGTFSYLNCAYGHYTWLWETDEVDAKRIIQSTENYFIHEKQRFKLAFSYRYISQNIIGEFPYDVVDVKNIRCFDYTFPPHIISIEQKGQELEAFRGRHFKRSEIAAIFDIYEIRFQPKEGVGIAQPFYGNLNTRVFNRSMLLFAGVLIVIASIFGSVQSGQNLERGSLLVEPGVRNEFISNTFVLPEKGLPHYLSMRFDCSLSNEWIEPVVTLVNEKTGDEREAGGVIEYYSGVTDGYSWSEGGNSTTVNLSSVPAGKYHVKITYYEGVSQIHLLMFTIRKSYPTGWNVGITLAIIAGLLALINLLKYRFEKLRSGEALSLDSHE